MTDWTAWLYPVFSRLRVTSCLFRRHFPRPGCDLLCAHCDQMCAFKRLWRNCAPHKCDCDAPVTASQFSRNRRHGLQSVPEHDSRRLVVEALRFLLSQSKLYFHRKLEALRAKALRSKQKINRDRRCLPIVFTSVIRFTFPVRVRCNSPSDID